MNTNCVLCSDGNAFVPLPSLPFACSDGNGMERLRVVPLFVSQVFPSERNPSAFHFSEHILVVTFGSKSIKTSSVVLYIAFLGIFKWPTRYSFKNKSGTIQPENLGKIRTASLNLDLLVRIKIGCNDSTFWVIYQFYGV